jgi:biopolymer transport protein ExbD
MKRSRQQMDDGVDSVDVTSLVDMVFILLIFFMVSTTFVKDMKIDLDRPGASSSESIDAKSIRVTIDPLKNIYVNGEIVKSWMIQSRIREALKEDKESSILVLVDKSIESELLIEVIDQCRLAGAKDIGVATDQEFGA